MDMEREKEREREGEREKRNDRERVREREIEGALKGINLLKERNGDTQVGKKNKLYTDIDRSIKNYLKHNFIHRH